MPVHLQKVERLSSQHEHLFTTRRQLLSSGNIDANDLNDIESKINSVLSTLDSLEDDIVDYKRKQISDAAKSTSVFDYIRAGFMFFIVIGVPFILIEVFARDWNKVNADDS